MGLVCIPYRLLPCTCATKLKRTLFSQQGPGVTRDQEQSRHNFLPLRSGCLYVTYTGDVAFKSSEKPTQEGTRGVTKIKTDVPYLKPWCNGKRQKRKSSKKEFPRGGLELRTLNRVKELANQTVKGNFC
ncbi:predicted protein [Histoplasma capsulatum G186AR]|uniref:Uncharacterized protein n=1 Tax=Ajellomyces capsulatus (strain G186AR / H82 / ATCC MYA-2454 / RMSCC 2432) TaxID=447093 RepID=C0NS48_AJECG|nr:uncharacterized protein HCBG_05978 [Histoplasma capsulatum G186AR]EEH05714.1 predicted protein [Histoplasma capsulatum G186AR]